MAEPPTSVDLDKEYSPSMWSRRFSTGKEVIEHYEQFVRDGTEKFQYVSTKCNTAQVLQKTV